ncbi:MAG: aspartate-semialdehyde dehydrogenase, partial [Firmicutes bacterium]|nr:aspartate-semialdehyde dehydrogenase [Bacillota bacterium]
RTTVRVPVFYGHSESINVEFEKPCSAENAKVVLSAAKGIVLVDDPSRAQYPYPLMCADKDEVFVGRVRKDFSVDNGINLWVVADNIRKGAATNAVQIAEEMLKTGLL